MAHAAEACDIADMDCCPPPGEAPPPYAPFDTDQGPPIAGDGPSAPPADGEPPPPPPLVSTEMAVATRAGRTVASQLLAPPGAIALEVADFGSVAVTVRAGETSGGLVRVGATLQHGPGVAVAATSQVDKAGQRTIRLGAAAGNARAQVECEIVLPTGAAAALDALALRLPAGTWLDVAGIGRGVVRRLDVAVIAGAVQLAHVHADSLRVAVVDGAISAADVAVGQAAEFVACAGQVRLSRCAAATVRANTPGAALVMREVAAETLSVRGRQAAIALRDARATVATVRTAAGSVVLDGVAAETLDVRTETAPVHGAWTVGRALRIAADSAMVQGQLALAADAVQAAVTTAGWPVRLAVARSFRGFFDVRAAGSVATFDLADAVFHERAPHHLQGVVGTGPSSIRVASAGSPVVITAL
ncbi:hypothetical protein H4R18_003476 [Coemansia javaensis]|uniref:Adhesin domain-containing protein n=1 Tax=Coemansia javaensis TaxID=2761396 RepID=A0A9W8HA95_9FUNG|nr:hypothetical protein H4R18_003476 [Coemansia javaensis]